MTSLLWFTRDLRLHDNATVHGAVAKGRDVVACYVLDEQVKWAPGGAARWYLHHALAALAESLEALGARLVLRRGDSAAEILRLARETDASELHVAQPIEPALREAVDRVEKGAGEHGCATHRHWTTLLFDPGRLRTRGGTPFLVFTPFAKAAQAEGVETHAIAAPGRMASGVAPRSDRLDDWGLLPTQPDWAGGLREAWTPGEAGAAEALRHFIGGALKDYAEGRNMLARDGVSRLSPHLHWGDISPRTVWAAAAKHSGKSTQSFLNELLWREFGAHLLWHHPDLPDAPLKTQFSAMRWRQDKAGLRAWRQGRTGIPIVDAGMRQLWHSGWQHNRARLITASFLIKHLLIDWRAGESWFWDTLVDADLGSNSSNWQWVAGCGADAAPFFRIFNPWLQGKKFDPDGDYVKRWVPELERLEARYIHAPWEAPAAALREAGVTLGKTYPEPIVDLGAARERALEAFRHISDKPMPRRAEA